MDWWFFGGFGPFDVYFWSLWVFEDRECWTFNNFNYYYQTLFSFVDRSKIIFNLIEKTDRVVFFSLIR